MGYDLYLSPARHIPPTGMEAVVGPAALHGFCAGFGPGVTRKRVDEPVIPALKPVRWGRIVWQSLPNTVLLLPLAVAVMMLNHYPFPFVIAVTGLIIGLFTWGCGRNFHEVALGLWRDRVQDCMNDALDYERRLPGGTPDLLARGLWPEGDVVYGLPVDSKAILDMYVPRLLVWEAQRQALLARLRELQNMHSHATRQVPEPWGSLWVFNHRRADLMETHRLYVLQPLVIRITDWQDAYRVFAQEVAGYVQWRDRLNA